MENIKLKAPADVNSVSVDGQQFQVAEDGTVDVPGELALQLYGFGFVNVPQPEAAKAQKAAKA